MSDGPFNNREIRGMFANIDLKLDTITEQTIKTNGRVNKLEERQDAADLWMSSVKGAIAVLVALVIPVLIYLVQQWISK